MRNCRASIWPSATLTALTPAPSGPPRPTSTWSVRTSISGLTAARSCSRVTSSFRELPWEEPLLIPALRDQFNRQFTAEKYARFLASIDSVSGTHVDFRCSETPVFFPKELLDRMAQYGIELYGQLAANPAYYRASEATIPEEYRVPNA